MMGCGMEQNQLVEVCFKIIAYLFQYDKYIHMYVSNHGFVYLIVVSSIYIVVCLVGYNCGFLVNYQQKGVILGAGLRLIVYEMIGEA